MFISLFQFRAPFQNFSNYFTSLVKVFLPSHPSMVKKVKPLTSKLVDPMGQNYKLATFPYWMGYISTIPLAELFPQTTSVFEEGWLVGQHESMPAARRPTGSTRSE
jgi:hypothetical protein